MPDPTELRLQFAYTYEDFHTQLTWRQRLSWIDLVGWLALAAAAILLLLMYGQKVDPAAKFDNGQIHNYLPYVLILGVGYLFMRFRHASRETWEKQNPPEVLLFIITPEHVILERAASRTQFQWNAFTSLTENERGFTLNAAPGYTPIFLPHRTMTPDQQSLLRTLANAATTTPDRAFEVLTTPTQTPKQSP